jgi:hypothetical protein
MRENQRGKFSFIKMHSRISRLLLVVATIILVSMNSCKDFNQPHIDASRNFLKDDDNKQPSKPFAQRHFVLDADKDEITLSDGALHNGRQTLQVTVDAAFTLNPRPYLNGEAILVFYYGQVKFPGKYSFYVQNVKGLADFNVEIKTDDYNIQWGVTRNLPEGVWKKIVIDIASAVESGTLDSNSINEILFHFEGKGTMMIDGLANNSNDPPIIQAVQNSEIKLVQSLLEQKTDINTTGFWGETALLRAVRNENTDIVKFLLGHGANVNVTAIETYNISTFHYGTPTITPLVSAIENNNLEIIKLLLDNGADVNLSARRRVSSGFFEKTPLEIAEKIGNKKIVELVKKNIDNE